MNVAAERSARWVSWMDLYSGANVAQASVP